MTGECTFGDCENPVYVQKLGLCKKHYQRHRIEQMTAICSEGGCTNKAHAKGLCSKHYQRRRLRFGTDRRDYNVSHLLNEKALEKDHVEAQRRRLILQLKRFRQERGLQTQSQ